MYQFRVLLVFSSAIILGTPSLVTVADNAWTKPNSGNWEEQAYWSLGVLPDATQSVLFTNAGWKALAIGANTAQNFPQSMRVQSLQVEGPADSFNTLLMNWSGFEQPLQVNYLTVVSNASVAVHGSVLEVIRNGTDSTSGNLFLGGTFIHADLSRVKVDGLLNIQPFGFTSQPWNVEPAAYFLTNGILTVGGLENLGSVSAGGRFVQHGGSNNVGSLQVGPLSEYNLYGGQVTATNGLMVGYGDFGSAHFFQHGGSVNADTDISGDYVLNGGTITGRMVVPSGITSDRADGHVSQNGGTNFAASLDMGLHAGRRGAAGYYALSQGLLRVASSVMIRGGTFSHANGVHMIASNLVMRGDAAPGLSSASAVYILREGTLSAGGITAYGTYFTQTGGSNLIAGDVFLTSPPPPANQFPPLSAVYWLEGGFFSARNLVVDAFLGGFRQSGGTSQITEKLTVQGSNSFYGYTFGGETLTVKDIDIGAGASFQHTNGNIIHSGVLILRQGNWYAGPGVHALGPLQLAGGQSNRISFPSGSSVLRLADSSAQPWAATAILFITNWHGSVSGGGATQIYFGSNANGLTPQQVAQIRFNISNNLYPARILVTGEVVPDMQPFTLSRSGNTLTLRWESGWTLQSSTNIAGPYEDVQGAASPYSPFMTGPRRFFRLRQ